MRAWELAELDATRAAAGEPYREFLRVPDLSAGLYVLAAGSLVFVAASVPHRFHGILETLRILVVFGPAEGSRT